MHPHTLTCPACGHSEYCRPAQLVERMQQQGMLRRTKDPEPALVMELFSSALARFRCSSCGQAGLTAEEMDEEEDDWDEARACAGCGQPIPAARLELFPNARRCAACEQKSGAPSKEEIEYCPRCGTPMELRTTRGSGISRYVWHCANCRR